MHPLSVRLASVIPSLPAVSWSGKIVRGSSMWYATRRDLPTGKGAELHGGRWNPKGLAALYGSLELNTALQEMLAYFRHAGLPEIEALPCAWVAFDVKLSRVLDLRSQSVRRRLGVRLAQLTGEPWREMQDRGLEALTQAIGRVAHSAGVQGLLVPSARTARGSNVVVFDPVHLPKGAVRIIKREHFPTHRRRKTP